MPAASLESHGLEDRESLVKSGAGCADNRVHQVLMAAAKAWKISADTPLFLAWASLPPSSMSPELTSLKYYPLEKDRETLQKLETGLITMEEARLHYLQERISDLEKTKKALEPRC